MGGDQVLDTLAADAEIARDHNGLAREGVRQGRLLSGSVETETGSAQSGDLFQVGGIVEVVEDAAGDDFADVLDLEQLLLRRCG